MRSFPDLRRTRSASQQFPQMREVARHQRLPAAEWLAPGCQSEGDIGQVSHRVPAPQTPAAARAGHPARSEFWPRAPAVHFLPKRRRPASAALRATHERWFPPMPNELTPGAKRLLPFIRLDCGIDVEMCLLQVQQWVGPREMQCWEESPGGAQPARPSSARQRRPPHPDALDLSSVLPAHTPARRSRSIQMPCQRRDFNRIADLGTRPMCFHVTHR